MEPTPATAVDKTAAVGVVVIGRNEGELLRRCLTAPGIQGLTTVYVDSGSTDGSVELAHALGVACVALDSDRPFSVSRGRNAGIAHLKQHHPHLAFVQFLDGDVKIDDEFIALAYEEILSSSTIGAVAGRLREDDPALSKYKRLCEMEWKQAPGAQENFSGNVMLRMSSLEVTGCYNETMLGGEDHELALRFRQEGWTIRTIDAPMGLHDSELYSFGQWWTRCVRGGYAYGHGAELHGDIGYCQKEVRSVAFWAGVFPVFLATAALLGFRWRVAWLGLGAAALYPVQWWRIRRHRLEMADSTDDAQLYATFVLIGKFAELRGLLRYRLSGTGPKASS